jgi:hypothetical protein
MRHIVATALGTLCATSLLAACATAEEAAVEAVAETYNATLTGAEEPGGGDPDGFGEAEVTVADNLNNICWEIKNIRGISTPTAAHIHRGARGVNGPPVFTLKQSNEGTWKGCSNRSEWTEDAIENNPSAYYVNVHTADYPNGAIRGQLRK